MILRTAVCLAACYTGKNQLPARMRRSEAGSFVMWLFDGGSGGLNVLHHVFDRLITSQNQLSASHESVGDHGVGHVVLPQGRLGGVQNQLNRFQLFGIQIGFVQSALIS